MTDIPNKSFCILPFIHLHLDEYSKIKLCCAATEPLKEFSSSFDFYNDPDLTEIREKMLSGEPVEYCKWCTQTEELGGESLRIRETNNWLKKLELKSINELKTELVYYDIRNDNTCNLACRMCYPGYSSTIEQEYIKLNLHKPINVQRYNINDIVNAKTIKKIYLAGGEPTLNPNFRSFLQLVIDAEQTDVEIIISTNGTNLNKEFISLLKNFSNVSIVVSVDGYEKINKYIRWPTNWNSLINNIKQLYEMKFNVSFNITVSIWNISNLSQLIYFLDNEFDCPNIMLNEAFGNDVKATNFPNKELALNDLNLIKNTQSYKTNQSFKNKLDYFITNIENTSPNLVDLADFFKLNDLLDSSRNVKLIDYIPELEACRKSLTKH